MSKIFPKKISIGYFVLFLYFLLNTSLVFGQMGENTPKTKIFNSKIKFFGGDMQRVLSAVDFPGLQKVISIDLRMMDIKDVFKFLALEGNLNIITSADIEGAVDMMVSDVTVGEILKIVFSMNNLAYQVEGNIIKVFSNDTFKVFSGEDFYDERETFIYKLKYASAKNVSAMLGNVKSDIGNIIFDDSTGVLVITDTPRKIQEMKDVIKSSELPIKTRVFELQYAKVEDVQAEVSTSLSPTTGVMWTDTRTNTFVITDFAERMEKIEKIIKAFDRKTREVFIEAKIVQVSLSDKTQWGIDWDKLLKNATGYKGTTVTPEVNMPVGLQGVSGASYGALTISKSPNLNMVLEFLTTVGKTKILSNPHIAVEEGKESTINVIIKQPYSQSTTTTTNSATTQSQEFSFEEVGVKLTVTPTINKDGYISMIISPEVSSITSFFPSDAAENRVPVVETANAETTVLVKDGTTIIIAGMIKDTKIMSMNKVPVLGDVPILGKMFKNTSDDLRRTETIVFLTPTIINGDEPYTLRRARKKEPRGIKP